MRNKECWWIFKSYNTDSLYGFGTEFDAKRYVDMLNKNTIYNCWDYYSADDNMTKKLNANPQSGFSLSDAFCD